MGTLQFGLSAIGAGVVSVLFDGTAIPLTATMAVCALAALAITVATPPFRPAVA